MKNKSIKARQHYYFLGRQYAEENKIEKAIETYKIYSTHLAEENEHTPYHWISTLYDKLGEKEKSLDSLSQYAKGCSSPKAADLYKEIGKSYIDLNLVDKAIISFEKSLKIDPENVLIKKVETLKNLVK